MASKWRSAAPCWLGRGLPWQKDETKIGSPALVPAVPCEKLSTSLMPCLVVLVGRPTQYPLLSEFPSSPLRKTLIEEMAVWDPAERPPAGAQGLGSILGWF